MPLIPLLLGLAPTVASWLMGDKTGAAISKVTGIARDILGTDDANGIEQAIAADPNLALQFKMAVIQAEADARRQEFETMRAQLADVQSAREQTVKLAQSGSLIAWAAPIVSIMAVAVFCSMIYMLFTGTVPTELRDALMILVGTSGSGYTAVLGYWLGSSAGSAQKTTALEKAAMAGR